MSSVLTPEETAALRENISQADPGSASPAPGSPGPTDGAAAVEAAARAAALGEAAGRHAGIFSAAGERGLQKKLPGLHRRFTIMAERLRGSLGKVLRTPVNISGEPAATLVAGAIADTVPTWAVTAEMRWSELGHAGYIGINYPLAYALIELAYGASPSQLANFSLKDARQRLTEVERQTLMPLIQTLSRIVADVMPAHLVGSPQAQLLAYPVQVDPTHNVEGGALKVFELKIGTAQAQIFVIVFSHVLEHIDDEHANGAAEASQMLSSHLGQTDVTLTAMLGKTQVALSSVLSLKSGDMLWLDSAQTDYLPIYVEESIKFLAQPIARNGALGVEIVAKVP
jgi:flagellar motor switch protein FliM